MPSTHQHAYFFQTGNIFLPGLRALPVFFICLIITKVDGGVAVIKNVAALMCDLYEEAYLTREVS